MVQNTWVREQRLLHNAEVPDSEVQLCRQLYICCLPILGLGNFHLLSCLGSMDFTFVYVAITRSSSVLPLWVIPISTPPSNHSVPHAADLRPSSPLILEIQLQSSTDAVFRGLSC